MRARAIAGRSRSPAIARFAAWLFALATAAMLGFAAAPLAAQQVPSPPQPYNVDGNGVDLVSRTVVASARDLAIGPEDHRGLTLTRQWVGNGWRIVEVPTMSGSTSVVRVTVGGRTWTFNRINGAYVAAFEDGSTLDINLTRFTSGDGMVVEFEPSGQFMRQQSELGIGRRIIWPDGTRHEIEYEPHEEFYSCETLEQCSTTYVRPTSINSNTGFQIKLTYASATYQAGEWERLASATAINNTIDGCDTGVGTCSFTRQWPKVTYSGGSPTRMTSVTDPLNRATTYGYSASDLASITPPGTGTPNVSYGYTSGKVTSVSRNGGAFSYSAPTTGTTSIVLPGGPGTRTSSIAFSTDGLVTNHTDPLGNVSSFTYCGTGQTNCPKGLLKTAVSAQQNTTALTYDARGNVTQTVRTPRSTALGETAIVTQAAYPPSCTNPVTCNKPVWTKDARGNQTDYDWSGSHGGLVAVTSPADANGVRPYTYITYGQVYARYKNASGTLVQSPNPVWQPNFSASCRQGSYPACRDTANQIQYTYEYQPSSSASNGLLERVWSVIGDGSVYGYSTIAYDYLARPSSVDGPLPGAEDTSFAFYNLDGTIKRRIGPDPDGGGPAAYPATDYAYSASTGLPSTETSGTVTSPAETATLIAVTARNLEYDVYRRTKRQTLSGGGNTHAVTDVVYDVASRVTCQVQRMDPTSWGSPATNCNPQLNGAQGADRVTHYTYDLLDRPIVATTGYGTALARDEQSMTYTANGLLETLTDAENNRTTYVYDGHDRLYRTRFPQPSKGAAASSTSDYEQYGYDADGNLTSMRTRRGENFAMSYDALGRMVSKIVPERSGLAAINTRDVFYAFDLFGNLTQAKFDNLSGPGVTFAYDARSRLLSETQAMASGQSRTISHGYDVADNQITMTFPDGQFVRSWRYGAGALNYSQLNANSELFTVYRDAPGRAVQLIRFDPVGGWATSARTHYAYDAASRLSAYSFDLAGTANDSYRSFAYNPAHQITTRSTSNDVFAWQGHADVPNRSYTSNGLNQYTQIGGSILFCHDANGNLSADDNAAEDYGYVYDPENRLVEMRVRPGSGCTGLESGTLRARLAYDPLGRLWQVEGFTGTGATPTGTTRFLWDGDELSAEYDAGGNLLRRYVHGGVPGQDDPMVWFEGSDTSNSARRYLFADERGSIVAVTDAQGNPTSINSYDEYGIPDGSGNDIATKGRFRYTGQMWLPELGMYYYKARIYSPTLGRFLQTDPIGYGDGMNMYRYVANDPVNGVDPSGLCGEAEVLNDKGQCVIEVHTRRTRTTISSSGGLFASFYYRGVTISQPGVYYFDGEILEVEEKALKKGDKESDALKCLGSVAFGVGLGALNPSGTAINAGKGIFDSVNRTGPNDARFLSPDEQAQSRNQGRMPPRSLTIQGGLRIIGKKIIEGHPAVRAAGALIGGGAALLTNPSCGIGLGSEIPNAPIL